MVRKQRQNTAKSSYEKKYLKVMKTLYYKDDKIYVYDNTRYQSYISTAVL